MARLAFDVARTEDVRAVRKLQISYAQYSQFGLWSQMAALFARDGEAIYGADDIKGAAAIGSYYREKWGQGREGLAAGGLHTELIDTPVIHLSADGVSAKGRWRVLSMTGQYGGSAAWAAGIMENDYVKQGAVWKIARVHYFPFVAGSYEQGWKSVAADLPLVPFHYTAATASSPIAAPSILPRTNAAALDKRIAALNDEDAVTNLQNAYGYYIDRKMWDDVVDLFTQDAVLEEADTGIYVGVNGIRRDLLRSGPPGLKRGELNDRPIFNTIVTVTGREARARGVEFSQLADTNSATQSWRIAVFENRYAKGDDGKWRIREMRLFPIMDADYYQGWHKSRIIAAPVIGPDAPDRPSPDADQGTQSDGAVPDFYLRHPVTGMAVALPKGTKVAGKRRLLPAPASSRARSRSQASLPELQRLMARSTAYDAVDNLSHAFSFYIDDFKYDEEGQLYAKDGWRGKNAVAFFQGPEHITRGEFNWDGPLAIPRLHMTSKWQVQSVILISEDGQSARMRNRLFRLSMDPDAPGRINGAMYANSAAKIEDGIWKIDVMSVDEPYWEPSSYADGAARARKEGPALGPRTAAPASTLRTIAPDVPRSDFVIRYHGIMPGDVIAWPDIKPMWFNYVNPVSGREPPLYCPDLKTCEKDLEAKAKR